MLETLEALETPVHSPEKKLVLKAISESPQKITVADIATKTNLPVLQANGLLNQIAYETGGHLTVGTAGSVVYEFDRNFQNEYISRTSKNTMKRLGRIIYNAGAYMVRIFSLLMFFLIRVSFGIALIASVVLVVALVVLAAIALLAKLMGNDNDSGPDIDLSGIFSGVGGIFRYWIWDWLWDWWYWGSYIRWDPTPTHYEPSTINSSKNQKDKENFLDKCFSFLFGDGDPNQQLEQKYWQSMALAIRANNGVVVAEQLAPYTLVESKNEDWMLPVMVRFNGNCDVSEKGNIIYNFPSFQQQFNASTEPNSATAHPDDLSAMFQSYVKTKAAFQSKQAYSNRLETYLKEHEWQLTHISDGSKATIICFALVILLGGIWLSTMTGLLPFIALIKPLLYAMSAYGALFLVIPGIRILMNSQRNQNIEKRNLIRAAAAAKLQQPDSNLKLKLKEAESSRRISIQESNREGIAFTTEKDSLEQEFEHPDK